MVIGFSQIWIYVSKFLQLFYYFDFLKGAYNEKNVSLKLVGILVDDVTEDLGFEEVQDDDIVIGGFPEEAKELYVVRFKMEEELTKIKEDCGGNDGNGINFRKKQCRRCANLQIAIKDIGE